MKLSLLVLFVYTGCLHTMAQKIVSTVVWLGETSYYMPSYALVSELGASIL